MHRTTLKLTVPIIQETAIDLKEANHLYYKRQNDITKAKELYPHIAVLEDAYFAYCREHNVKFIPTLKIHHYAAALQGVVNKQAETKILCTSCNQLTVSVDPLCSSCEQFAQGMRSSLYCSNCLQTTFSPKSVNEIISESQEVITDGTTL